MMSVSCCNKQVFIPDAGQSYLDAIEIPLLLFIIIPQFFNQNASSTLLFLAQTVVNKSHSGCWWIKKHDADAKEFS